jgi:hypothetical protein
LGKPLSAAAVAKLKKQGRYGVGDGVYLQISKWKTRAWVFRYERFGKAHYMGLGPCHLISLAQARAKGRDAQRMLLDGDDPLSAKRQKRANEALRLAREQTFEQCALAYLADHDVGWSAASSAQWRQSLSAYVFPVIGKLPVAEIDLPLLEGAGADLAGGPGDGEPCPQPIGGNPRLGNRAGSSRGRQSSSVDEQPQTPAAEPEQVR